MKSSNLVASILALVLSSAGEAFAINDHDQAAGYGEVLVGGGCCAFYAVVCNNTTPSYLPGPPGYSGASEARGTS